MDINTTVIQQCSSDLIGGSRRRARRTPPVGPDSFVLAYKIFET